MYALVKRVVFARGGCPGLVFLTRGQRVWGLSRARATSDQPVLRGMTRWLWRGWPVGVRLGTQLVVLFLLVGCARRGCTFGCDRLKRGRGWSRVGCQGASWLFLTPLFASISGGTPEIIHDRQGSFLDKLFTLF